MSERSAFALGIGSQLLSFVDVLVDSALLALLVLLLRCVAALPMERETKGVLPQTPDPSPPLLGGTTDGSIDIVNLKPMDYV